MINHSTPKLMNSAYFGPNGIVKTSIVLVPLNGSQISANMLSNASCQAVLVGTFGEIDGAIGTILGKTELTAIRKWSLEDSRNLVIISQYEANIWGYTGANGNINPNVPTGTGAKSKIFDGPFGKVLSFNQGGSYQGSLTGSNGINLAIESNGRPTILLDKNTHDLILGDVDILTDLGGISLGPTIQNMNDVLFANIWAYAIDLASGVAVIKSNIQGQIFDKATLKPIEANLQIDGSKTGPQNVPTSNNGQYDLKAVMNEMLKVTILKSGYQSLEESFAVDKISLVKNFFLNPIVTSAPKVPKTSFRGKTINKVTGLSIKSRIDFSSNGHGSSLNTDDNGDFSIQLDEAVEHALNISSDGFYDTKDLVNLKSGQLLERLYPMTPKTEILNEVKFHLQKSKLLEESKPQLNRLVEILQESPSMEIRLEGHTDKIGDSKLNMELSIKRVEAVKEYLTTQGISPHRIQTVGYGDTKLIKHGCPKEIGCEENRRVAFVVVKK